jgi:osmotically-inducible protein OsmY
MQYQNHSDGDSHIRYAVTKQIEWDPEVASFDISVSARHGVVTLTGFVHNYSEKVAAEKAAKSVYGVMAVANDIVVEPAGSRSDPEIARDLVHALRVDVTIPEGQIKAGVKDGFVTLEGNVNWNFQRIAATNSAQRIAGVRGVINNLMIKPTVSPEEVKAKIEDALKRNAEVDARRITVFASDGTVYLNGNVRSWFEKEEAERAAWAAPGVTNIVDNVSIVP